MKIAKFKMYDDKVWTDKVDTCDQTWNLLSQTRLIRKPIKVQTLSS
jgi:hypothetical protein